MCRATVNGGNGKLEREMENGVVIAPSTQEMVVTTIHVHVMYIVDNK